MSNWSDLCVPHDIIKILMDSGFHKPTPIQCCVIPTAIRDRSDILGAAPTGSGKTLSFGIPLIARISAIKKSEAQSFNGGHPCADQMDVFEAGDTPCDLGPVSTVIQPVSKPPQKRKKMKLSDVYQNLAIIEELDVDTGDIINVHCLLDDDSPGAHTTTYSQKRIKGTSERVGNKSNNGGRIYGLVLVPTRELAMQIHRHLKLVADNMEFPIRVEAIVGGMSVQKQVRLLDSIPDILVATPGRLWHLIQEGNRHVCSLRQAVEMLVVDEADRLLEANHFDDLRKLFTWLDGTTSAQSGEAHQAGDLTTTSKRKRQTLVFSATLTFVHRGAIRPGTKRLKQRSDSHMTKELKLGALRRLLGLNSRAKVFDLSSTPPTAPELNNSTTKVSEGTVVTSKASALGLAAPEGLQEFRLSCRDQPSKDVLLFWFLAFARHHHIAVGEENDLSLQLPKHNVRSLVFLNSKSGVRRLAGIMRLLADTKAFSISRHSVSERINVLHADMPQKQRLRALERFQADPCGILIASDVASRGLDLAMETISSEAGVAWVVHFEVPHTAELYVHRRGRTARAAQTGTSILFLSPNEILRWRRIVTNLARCSQAPLGTSFLDLSELPINPSQYESAACEQIVTLAKQLDLAEHSVARKKINDNWFNRAAKEADILLESDTDEGFYANNRKSARKSMNDISRQDQHKQQEFSVLRSQLSKLVSECSRSLLTKPSCLHVAPSKKVVTSLRKQLKQLKNGTRDCMTQPTPVHT